MATPAPLSLFVDAPEATFESGLLGELFDRRNNSIGFQITQPLKELVDLKLLNRLQQATSRGESLAVSSADLLAFLRPWLEAIECSSCKWYWFQNHGAEPPLHAIVQRVTAAAGPSYFLDGGFNQCINLYDGDGTTDIRQLVTFDTDEGVIEIHSETTAERFSSEIGKLVDFLLPIDAHSECFLRFASPHRKKVAKELIWKTFDRKRLPKRAQPLSRTIHKILGERLSAAGFAKLEEPGWIRYQRDVGNRKEYLVFQRARFESAFSITLGWNEPSARPRADLFCPTTHVFLFTNDKTLEDALTFAWDMVSTIGFEWLSNPHARTREQWLADHIIPLE